MQLNTPIMSKMRSDAVIPMAFHYDWEAVSQLTDAFLAM